MVRRGVFAIAATTLLISSIAAQDARSVETTVAEARDAAVLEAMLVDLLFARL